jgi:hypothetical protein
MITKHVPMTSAKKSDFAGLVAYITGPHGKAERVGTVRVTNCQTDQVDIAMLAVLNTQAQNTRSVADKTYHLVIGFPAGEFPAEEILESIESRVCAALGFGEHQRVSVVHHDTDNLHLHIAINKINPTRYTIHEPFNAYHILGKLCETLEVEYGLQKVNHKSRKSASENRADDMERHTAVESLIGWIKRECLTQMQSAPSWSEMHQVLQQKGLRIHQRGNGMVITSETSVSVKASSVDREFSGIRLEARLGAFTMPPDSLHNERPDQRYNKMPVPSRFDTGELYTRYKSSQDRASSARRVEWDRAQKRKNSLIEDAKRTGRLKRAAIQLIEAPRTGKRLMYSAVSKTLRDDIAEINRLYKKERQAIYEKYQRHAWGDWLQREAQAGDQDALDALRARRPAADTKFVALSGRGGRKTAANVRQDSITKKGTIIYSVDACAIRDEGNKLTISRGADRAGLETAIKMAMDRFGDRISVNGSATFKEHVLRAAVASKLTITFDDDALERRRQQLSQPVTRRENRNGNDHCTNKRRFNRGGNGGGERVAAASRGCTKAWDDGSAQGVKSRAQVARPGPPPTARHGLRELSKLGVVHVTDRSEMLLPRHVPGDVERQGAESDHRMRRPVHRTRLKTEMPVPMSAGASRKPNVARIGSSPPPASKDRLAPLSQLGAIAIGNSPQGLRVSASALPAAHLTPPAANLLASEPITSRSTPAIAAAEKYAIEREQKRRIGFDIPKHKPFTFTHALLATYAGTRTIDGQRLALLKVGDEVTVLPVDNAIAQRLRRLSLGAKLSVSQGGAIKPKGRSR